MIEDKKLHYYLYAKLYYLRGDLWEDLAKIHAYAYNYPPQYVSRYDILTCLLEMVFDELNKVGMTRKRFRDFIIDIWAYRYLQRETPPQEALAYQCLGVLQRARNVDLPDADPSLLPTQVT